jgi:TolB-like protein/Flp pilus assembly protein TadD
MTLLDRTLGHYRVLTPLGRGGMGEVFVAQDIRLGRRVALKVLPEEVAGSADRRERFEREARAVAALSHPNILAIHDFGEHDGVVYAVMELLEGETLRSRLDRGALPAREAIEHGRRIVDGLSAAHQRGIIHRDLKPENVFLTRDGLLKILDFGLAKLATPPGDTSTVAPLTEAGVILGTVGYGAPEQMRGEAADARADIFSVGAILYEMLAGHRAFRGASSLDVVAAILNLDAPPLPLSGPNAEGIANIVTRCLDKRPDQRFQSARDLGFALEATAAGAAALPGAASSSRPKQLAAGVTIVLLLAAAVTYVAVTWVTSPSTAVATAGEGQPVRIAVLPFENLGPPEDAYFASGVTEEITNRLAMLSGLGVISRTSAAQFAESGRNTKEIGKELGAAYLLLGGVRWIRDGNGAGRVRITPQLVRVLDDTQIWTDQYDRALAELFSLQSEIAERIAVSLDLKLLEPQRRITESSATTNLQAYQAYLRGIDAASAGDSISRSGSQLSVESFEQAVALDPGFAIAHARLSSAHSTFFRLGYDMTDARLASALASAERARELQPDLPWTHLALGSYYYARDEYDQARREFLLAQRAIPGASEVHARLGNTARRQGRFDEALSFGQRAAELDPRSAREFRDIGMTLGALRRYEEAIGYEDRSIALDPNQLIPYWEKTGSQLNLGRPLDEVRRTLERMPQKGDAIVLRAWLRLELLARNYQAALLRIQDFPGGFVDQNFVWPQPLLLAETYRFLGDVSRARPLFHMACDWLERERGRVPDDPRVLSALGLAYAGLGRKEDAIREARRAVDLMPATRDAMRAPARVHDLARVYTMVGEYGAALDALDRLLSMPYFFFSVNVLELEPIWDPLRNEPGYRSLVDAHRRETRGKS